MTGTARLTDLDANGRPIYGPDPFTVSKAVTFTTNGAVVKKIFKVTGSVEVGAIYGVVTTAIGSNHTAAYFRIDDQTLTNQVITLATGVTMSSLPAGSLIMRTSLVGVAAVASTAATGLVTDPIAATVPQFFMPFVITQKTGAIETDIEYVYTTNNTSLGAMTFYVRYRPLTSSSIVIPA